jgi:UDP-glucose-4-epimerase GalE
MHFAAKSLVAESVSSPELYYNNNIGGTLALLEALESRGINKFVFSSTCAIYAATDALIAEGAAKGPLSPYGFTKLACEQMMDDFDRAHGLKSVRLRYFNAAAADPDGEIGEHHMPETHLIPIALDVALGRRERLQVYGTDYPTPDGSAIRDYIHVLDLADAHLKAVEYLEAGGPTAALNLGTGVGRSVLEVVKAAELVTRRTIPTDKAPRRAGDAAALVADPALARATLGWTATHSELPEILADAWRWHRARFGGATGGAGFPE